MLDYRVQLETFHGPLDLLLYLVRKQEVDILNLPIAEIAAQFLDFLEVLQAIDLDVIGDFVVLASTLVEIKSRMVLPENAETPELIEPAGDPRSDLVKQLLEYKRFRDAASLLEEQAAEWQLRFPRLSDDRPRSSGNPAEDLIKEVELWDLVSALSRVLRGNSETQPSTIIYDDTPIGVYIEQIRERVQLHGRVSFSEFFRGTNSRSKIVGIFLAILELLRHYSFRAEQQDAYGEIWVLPPRRPDEPLPLPPEETPAEPLRDSLFEEAQPTVGMWGTADSSRNEDEELPLPDTGQDAGDEFTLPDLSHLGLEDDAPPRATEGAE